jgi:mono/diheme cytochrome c family protein
MHDQPRLKPFAPSEFFADQRSARPLVPGTVARGELRENAAFHTGKAGSEFVRELPVPVTLALLQHGRTRFDAFCSPCHGRTGSGDGPVPERGFKRPPSYHAERLRAAPPGYIFDVISNGFGAMSDHAAQVPAADRWAIVAYVRALQLSQHAELADVPAEKRTELERLPP